VTYIDTIKPENKSSDAPQCARPLRTASCSSSATLLLLGAATLLSGCGNFLKQFSGSQQQQQAEQPALQEDLLEAWKNYVNQGNQQASSADGAQSEPVIEEFAVATGATVAGDVTRYTTTNRRRGSRLALRMAVTDEGYQSGVGWRDTELDENCKFERDAHDTLRCFPTRATRNLFYADADCSQGIAAVRSNTHYAYRIEGAQCAGGIQPFALGAQIETPREIFTLDSAGACVATPVPEADFRALGAPIALERFVAARYGIEGTDSRVKAVGLVADDGAIKVTEFMDSELDTRCMWQGTDAARCLPKGQNVSAFADAVCTQPLIEAEADECTEGPTFGTDFGVDACGDAFYRPGSAFEGNTVYELSAEGYKVTSVDSEEAGTLRMGERLGDHELATATVVRNESANTRLAPAHWKTPDGNVWFSHWHDNLLESECTFMSADDDEWRCLPSNAGDRVLYADEACTEPVTEVQDVCGETRAPEFVIEQAVAADGQATLDVRRVLSPRSLSTVYEKSTTGACEGHAAPWNSEHFDLSAVLPKTDFVRGLVVIR